jgi:hypothetical protein
MSFELWSAKDYNDALLEKPVKDKPRYVSKMKVKKFDL